VPGEGSPTARVMFIGEAPGFHEDQQGRPFVGQSGQLLNKLLSTVNLQREQVFIANVVKCHPPQNLDPTPAQMAACKPYLDRQIEAINPRLIITLGRFSMARYWPGQRISQIHGQVKQADGRLYLPMFHPAAALRDRDRTLPMFKADGFKIPALLEQAEEIARNEIWGYPVESKPDPEPARPLAVAEAPAIFIETAQVAPEIQLEPDITPNAPGQPDVPVTIQENAPGPEKVPVKVKRPARIKPAAAEPSGESLPGMAALPGEIAPGLSLAEATEGRTRPKTPAVPGKPRRKRPAIPGEQLSMW
jgi:uracil-DNA glycosylase family 4